MYYSKIIKCGKDSARGVSAILSEEKQGVCHAPNVSATWSAHAPEAFTTKSAVTGMMLSPSPGDVDTRSMTHLPPTLTGLETYTPFSKRAPYKSDSRRSTR